MTEMRGKRAARWIVGLLVLAGAGALASAGMTGCTKSSTTNISTVTSASPVPTATTQLSLSQDLPGLNLNVVSITGGTGPKGNFRAGDSPVVTFTVKRNDGSDMPLAELDLAETIIAGPSFGYQPLYSDALPLAGNAPMNQDLTYTFVFPPIPATYVQPANYSGKFTDGVLAGQPLLSGTYTLAIMAAKLYTKGTEQVKDTSNVTVDFLLGDATAIEHREVVTQRSCGQCHENLSHHSEHLAGGGLRTSVTTCVLCHTAGAEDWNSDDATLRSPTDPNAPPPATVEFKVMIHKIHNGFHLPSVNGVGVDATGNRDYTKAPSHYATIDDELQVNDHTTTKFPVFLSSANAMPRRTGYSALTGTGKNGLTFKQNDDTIRTGVISCDKCHGEPVGDPVGFARDASQRVIDYPAPAQGALAYNQPSRRACGACHDDIDWTKPFTNNGKTMPPQLDDSKCITCHAATGTDPDSGAPGVIDAHLHPLKNLAIQPAGAQGLTWAVTGVTPLDGTGATAPQLVAGGKLQVTLSVNDFQGDPAPIAAIASSLANLSFVISGPTTNYNILQYTAIPPSHSAFATPASSYAFNVPDGSFLELVGNATGTAGNALAPTSLTPHWRQYTSGLPTYVHEAKAPAVAIVGSLTVAAAPMQNWIDIAQPSSGSFSNKDYLVIDRGLPSEEYLRVTLVEPSFRGGSFTRLWLTSKYSQSIIGTNFGSLYGPWVRKAHAAGAVLSKVTLTAKTENVHYTLDQTAGVVTEAAGGFTSGRAVLVSYTGDWVLPTVYPPSLNNSSDLDDSVGKWAGKSIVDGSYTIGVWSTYTWPYAANGETNSYRLLSTNATLDFLLGVTPTVVVPYGTISRGDSNCAQCHDEVMFHGSGRQDFVTCILCHGTSGAEDRPRYIGVVVNGFAGTPDTRGLSVKFSSMLHKIHRGSDLAKAATYEVVGFDPKNPSTWSDVVFPALPARTRQCFKCHGLPDPSLAAQVWDVPKDRSHPTQQVSPMNPFTFVCGSCHDADSTAAHFALMSNGSPPQESCSVCHGSPGATYFTGTVHQNQRKKY